MPYTQGPRRTARAAGAMAGGLGSGLPAESRGVERTAGGGGKGLNEALPNGVGGRLRSVGYARFVQDAADVVAYGLEANE